MMHFNFLKRSLLLFAISLFSAISFVSAQVPATAYSFSASSSTYTPLSGGSVINFTTYPDDVTVQDILLGFPFTFCGVSYDRVSACTNGFISFANGTTSTTGNSSGGGIDPAVFPLWDDLSGFAGTASYLTTGAPGSQVFTIEYKNWSWYYKTSTPYPVVISFQVKLYESNGRIEFVYNREADAINGTPSASIGIIRNSSDYQTLNSTSASPTVTTTSFYTSINTKPATGQSYVWDPPPPCPRVLPIVLGGYNSTAASFSWSGASGALGYDYAIDNNADKVPGAATTVKSTTVTSGNANGLTPGTRYYVHVRSKCSAVSISQWDTISFVTLPACSRPGRITVLSIDSSSVSFQWPAVATAANYQYIIDSSTATPVNTDGATATTTPFVSRIGLMQDKVYYVHYRSLCAGNDSSAWALDSFRIPIPCRIPDLQITSLTDTRAIIFWQPVNTAIGYEYAFNTSATPPAIGTPTTQNTLQFPYLQPAKDYNVHVRCSCLYYGVSTVSDWNMLAFKTMPPLAISNAQGNGSEISVYPNPVKDVLRISIADAVDKEATITISDINGKTIKQIAVDSKYLSIDMLGTTPGIYLLRYNSNNTVKAIRITKE